MNFCLCFGTRLDSVDLLVLFVYVGMMVEMTFCVFGVELMIEGFFNSLRCWKVTLEDVYHTPN